MLNAKEIEEIIDIIGKNARAIGLSPADTADQQEHFRQTQRRRLLDSTWGSTESTMATLNFTATTTIENLKRRYPSAMSSKNQQDFLKQMRGYFVTPPRNTLAFNAINHYGSHNALVLSLWWCAAGDGCVEMQIHSSKRSRVQAFILALENSIRGNNRNDDKDKDTGGVNMPICHWGLQQQLATCMTAGYDAAHPDNVFLPDLADAIRGWLPDYAKAYYAKSDYQAQIKASQDALASADTEHPAGPKYIRFFDKFTTFISEEGLKSFYKKYGYPTSLQDQQVVNKAFKDVIDNLHFVGFPEPTTGIVDDLDVTFKIKAVEFKELSEASINAPCEASSSHEHSSHRNTDVSATSSSTTSRTSATPATTDIQFPEWIDTLLYNDSLQTLNQTLNLSLNNPSRLFAALHSVSTRPHMPMTGTISTYGQSYNNLHQENRIRSARQPSELLSPVRALSEIQDLSVRGQQTEECSNGFVYDPEYDIYDSPENETKETAETPMTVFLPLSLGGGNTPPPHSGNPSAVDTRRFLRRSESVSVRMNIPESDRYSLYTSATPQFTSRSSRQDNTQRFINPRDVRFSNGNSFVSSRGLETVRTNRPTGSTRSTSIETKLSLEAPIIQTRVNPELNPSDSVTPTMLHLARQQATTAYLINLGFTQTMLNDFIRNAPADFRFGPAHIHTLTFLVTGTYPSERSTVDEFQGINDGRPRISPLEPLKALAEIQDLNKAQLKTLDLLFHKGVTGDLLRSFNGPEPFSSKHRDLLAFLISNRIPKFTAIEAMQCIQGFRIEDIHTYMDTERARERRRRLRV